MLIRILLLLTAVVFGFFFPGIFGAVVFALLLILVVNGLKVKSYNLKRVAVSFILSFIAGFGLMWFFGLMGANEILYQRVDALKAELIQMGHHPKWFIISQRRNEVYNGWLSNSVDDSKHLEGKAIDLYIIDINGDNQYDREDFKLIERAHNNIQKRENAHIGDVFDYLKKGFFARRMVHVQLN
jgi:hypothetical protein